MTSEQHLSISLSHTADDELRDTIHAAIKAFNDAVSPAHRAIRATGGMPLDIAARDDDGRLIGGLTALTYWGWLDIDDLWLREDYRRAGIGSTLLQTAEKEARRRDCRRALVKTFSFQAREFYEKHGYEVVGELADYPPGESLFWLAKQL